MLRGFLSRGGDALGSDTLTNILTGAASTLVIGTLVGVVHLPYVSLAILIPVILFNLWQQGVIRLPEMVDVITPTLNTTRIDREVLKVISDAGTAGITPIRIIASVKQNTSQSEYPLDLSVGSTFGALKRLYKQRKIIDFREDGQLTVRMR